MKTLAFNCSPHMEKGCTALILDPFIEGMKKEGSSVELYFLRLLKINPCQGDIRCWIKTPGHCFQNDDMQLIYAKLQEADIIVFGTPVYVDGMPGPMKNLVDRLIPIMEPYIEIRDDHCRHTLPKGHKRSKTVLVSTCGFWEMDNFNPLVTHMQAICKNAGWEYVGALLRPHSDALSYMLRKNLPAQDVIEAAEEAGRQLVRDGEMKQETLRTVSRELGSRETCIAKLNESFKRTLSSYG